MITEQIKYKQTGIEWLPQVPEHWQIVRLKNVCQVINGATPSSNVTEYWDGNINWVTPAEFGDEMYINDSVRKITEQGLKSCATSLIPKGSIIISTRAPIGSLAIANIELCTNQGCRSIIAEKINNYFVYYFLSIQTATLNILGNGTTFKELSGRILKDYKIPLPPKEEQDEIVSHIKTQSEKINRFIQKKQRFIELLKEQRQSIITTALSNKKGESRKLKSFSSLKGRIGFHGLNSTHFIDYGPYCITGTDFKNGEIDFTKCYHVSNYWYELDLNIQIQNGDLLVTKDGTIGKIAIVSKLNEKATLNSGVFVLRCDQKVCDTNFLYWLLQSDIFNIQLDLIKKGTTINHLFERDFRNFLFPIPPIEEQKQIVQYIRTETQTIDKAIAKAEKEIELIKEYKEAMITEAVIRR